MSKNTGRPAAVDIQKSVYTLASMDGESAELTMYGDIYESQPVDFWTGKPVEGQFILLSDFLADLEQIADCKSLTIRMNSYGGDAGVSNTIHNRLRELARDGMKLTCVVDGVAMSGGSLIMCACDTVRVNPSSLVMIHKCWTSLWGGYNADELRELASKNDAWDKMQAEIYHRKTGLSETVLIHMMSDTTYMTGREAVEKGFADEVIEDAEPLNIAASADRRSLLVNGRPMHLAPGMAVPDNIPSVAPGASAPVKTHTTPPAPAGANTGGNSMTLEELRAKYPNEIAQAEAAAAASADHSGAVNAAIQAERQRMQDIDEVSSLLDPAAVQKAKYGEHPCTAAELLLAEAKKAAKQGSKFLADLDADAKASGTGNVPAAPAPEGKGEQGSKTPEARMAEARATVKGLLGKKED